MELRECPFCGSKAVSTKCLYKGKSGGRSLTKIVCLTCLSTSGLKATTDEARDAWNRRAKDGN